MARKYHDQLQNARVVGDQNQETEIPKKIEKEHVTDRAQKQESADRNREKDRQKRQNGRNRETEDIILQLRENDQSQDSDLRHVRENDARHLEIVEQNRGRILKLPASRKRNQGGEVQVAKEE